MNMKSSPSLLAIRTTVFLESPIGPLAISGDGFGVHRIDFDLPVRPDPAEVPSPLRQARQQLAEYLEKKRREFSLTLVLAGTPFQHAVWAALARIPCGETRTYGEIAQAIGNPQAARAVGGAVHANPLSIVIPCHRVIGKDGSMTGFGGGIWRKEWLLGHEQVFMGGA